MVIVVRTVRIFGQALCPGVFEVKCVTTLFFKINSLVTFFLIAEFFIIIIFLLITQKSQQYTGMKNQLDEIRISLDNLNNF